MAFVARGIPRLCFGCSLQGPAPAPYGGLTRCPLVRIARPCARGFVAAFALDLIWSPVDRCVRAPDPVSSQPSPDARAVVTVWLAEFGCQIALFATNHP